MAEVETGRLRQLTTDGKGITSLQWSADGSEVIFTSRRDGHQRLWRIPAAGGSLRLVAGAPDDIQTFAISPRHGPREGRIAFTDLLQDVDTYIAGLDGQAPCSLKSSKADFNPHFSPDNRLVAFESTRTGGTEIWIASADCSNPIRLTYFNEAGVGSFRWSPDGRQLVFNRFNNGRPQIYTINIDGTDLRQLTDSPSSDFTPTWSHDGQTIYFSTDRFGRVEIARISINGGTVERVTNGGGRAPTASSDGHYLYYTRHEILRRIDLRTGRDEWIPGLEGEKVERYWCLSGDYVYFAPVKGSQQATIYRFNLRTRQTEKLFEIDGILPLDMPGVSVSRDQRRIAYSSISYRLSNIMFFDGFK